MYDATKKNAMSEQPRKPLTLYAMQYGVYMGVYLLIVFLFSAWSRYAAIFNTLTVFSIIAIPAVVYLIMSHFMRSEYGSSRFVVLWLLGIYLFFFASLISGLGEYLYCTFIVPDFIPSQIEAMLQILDTAEIRSAEMQEIVDIVRTSYEQGYYPTPIEMVYQMIWAKVFLGSIVSIFVALFIRIYSRFRTNR